MPKRQSIDPDLPLFFDLLECAAQFWNRPPEEIHRDPRLPFYSDPWVKAKIRQVGQGPQPLPEVLKPLPRSRFKSPKSIQDLLDKEEEEWPRLSPAERDRRLTEYLALAGPRSLADEMVQRHLMALWEQIHHTLTPQKQKEATERWQNIFQDALPKLQGKTRKKQSPNPLTILEAFEDAQRRVQEIRAQPLKSVAAYARKLRASFPDASEEHLQDLADALYFLHPDQRRDVLLAIIGARYRLQGSYLREHLLPQARRIRPLLNNVKTGEDRYRKWLNDCSLPETPFVSIPLPASE